MEHYVPPWVEELVEGSWSTTTTAANAMPSQSLAAVEEALLASHTTMQLLVMLGEGGVGKTSFLMRLGARLAADCRAFLLTCAANYVPAPWVPVLLELRWYTVDSLRGALGRHLERECGVPPSVVEALEHGHVPIGDCGVPLVRVVLLCDGMDDMADSCNFVQDFVATVCGGTAWPASVLRVVVTSRSSRPMKQTALVQVLLPFGMVQVKIPLRCVPVCS